MRTEIVQTKFGKDSYMMMSAGEIPDMVAKNTAMMKGRFQGASWYGETFAEFQKHVVTGENKRVAESEKFLEAIQDQVPVSKGWRNQDDVVGALPNVPAMLAGHPQHMRRRQRVSKETAPLSIYMDLTSSGGIGAAQVNKRGLALMALTRLLIEHRAVALWVGASLGGHGRAGTVAWQIDTAPLDLARATYHVSATSMSRLFGYSLNQDVFKTGGGWPFGNYGLHCQTAKTRLQNILGGDILYIEPIMLGDELTNDPIGWIKRTMAKYLNQDSTGE